MTRTLPPLLRFLIKEAAARYDLLESEVLERGRTPRKIAARADVAKELRRRGHSYPAIGRMFGGYHHTTILNLINPRRYRHVPVKPLSQWDCEAPDLSGEWAI